MTAQTRDLAAVVERLATVERQNGRLEFAGAMVLLLAAAGLVMGQAVPPSRTVEAEAFVLRDAGGTARAAWAPSPEGGAALTFFDQAGKPRATLYVVSEGSATLQLSDKDERIFWRVP